MKSMGMVVALCAAGVACTPVNLRFKQTTGGGTVAQTTLLAGTAWTPGDQEIAAALATCLDELTTELEMTPLPATRIMPSPRSELLLFARHPSEMTAFLAALSDAELEAGLAAFPRNEQVSWHPRAAVPSGFPHVAVVSTTGGAAAPLAMSTTQLFGPRFATGLSSELTMCHPRGDAGLLQPGASLKTTTLYNRGACRRDTALAPFLAAGNAQLALALKTKRHVGVGSVEVRYSILQSFVEQTGTGLSEPVGGMVLFLHYVAKDLLGNAPSHVIGAVRYDLAVVDGVVTLRPRELRWDHSGIWGPLSSEGALGQPGWHGALTRADGKMVTTINEQIRASQLLAPKDERLATLFALNECREVTDCGPTAGILGGLIAGNNRQRFNEAEVNRLRCAVGDPTGCAASGGTAETALRAHWVCQPPPGAAKKSCDMVIPVQRVVASPDSIGVVFFDRDELDNAAYALQAATGQLCEDPSVPLPTTRSFASSVLRD